MYMYVLTNESPVDNEMNTAITPILQRNENVDDVNISSDLTVEVKH